MAPAPVPGTWPALLAPRRRATWATGRPGVEESCNPDGGVIAVYLELIHVDY